ncbi:MAG: hypothetical protein WC817_04675 [Patescibacteria group bacterium]|jgi:hypothetical protein
MFLAIQNIGILVNAFICATVAGTAFALTLALFLRREQQNPATEAYAWFWWFTALVWSFSAIRYVAVSFGYTGVWVEHTDVLVQASVFLGGPALFYYLLTRVFGSAKIAYIGSSCSLVAGLIALGLALQQGGVPLGDVTHFSAESTINAKSFAIFGAEIAFIIPLAIFDLIHRLRAWGKQKRSVLLYDALHTAPLLLYVLLGAIDESKIITSWPLVIFRILYVAGFLFVYIVITQEEVLKEDYLFQKTETTATYA